MNGTELDRYHGRLDGASQLAISPDSRYLLANSWGK